MSQSLFVENQRSLTYEVATMESGGFAEKPQRQLKCFK